MHVMHDLLLSITTANAHAKIGRRVGSSDCSISSPGMGTHTASTLDLICLIDMLAGGSSSITERSSPTNRPTKSPRFLVSQIGLNGLVQTAYFQNNGLSPIGQSAESMLHKLLGPPNLLPAHLCQRTSRKLQATSMACALTFARATGSSATYRSRHAASQKNRRSTGMNRRAAVVQVSASDKPVLYDMPVSNNGARNRLIIYWKGLEDIIDIRSPMDLGGLKTDEYLALNPQGKMPLLVLPEGLSLPESEVISQYLLAKYADTGELRVSIMRNKHTHRNGTILWKMCFSVSFEIHVGNCLPNLGRNCSHCTVPCWIVSKFAKKIVTRFRSRFAHAVS